MGGIAEDNGVTSSCISSSWLIFLFAHFTNVQNKIEGQTIIDL